MFSMWLPYEQLYILDELLAADAESIKNTAQYTILLPGKALHLSALNTARKFRNKGNKEGGLQAFQLLEKEGLGKIESYTIPGQKTKVQMSYSTYVMSLDLAIHTFVCIYTYVIHSYITDIFVITLSLRQSRG